MSTKRLGCPVVLLLHACDGLPTRNSSGSGTKIPASLASEQAVFPTYVI